LAGINQPVNKLVRLRSQGTDTVRSRQGGDVKKYTAAMSEFHGMRTRDVVSKMVQVDTGTFFFCLPTIGCGSKCLSIFSMISVYFTIVSEKILVTRVSKLDYKFLEE